MPDFRFRAAAALELRRRQENDAGNVLVHAEARFRHAQAAKQAAETQRRHAQTAQVEESRRGTDVATIEWHRNWIIRLAATVERMQNDVDLKATAVQTAEGEWRDARRRRLVLERMKDRAWRRFQVEQQRQELKVIDELARLRHTMADSATERNDS
jgi:flagellar export protein FliJ